MKHVKGVAVYDDAGNIIDFIPESQNQPQQGQPQQGQPQQGQPQQTPPPNAKLTPQEIANYRGVQRDIDEIAEGIDVKMFQRKLANVMRDNMFDRTISGFRSGKLSPDKFRKLLTGGTRVFARRQERQNKNYSVSIILDVSGSMNENVYYGKREPEYQAIEKEYDEMLSKYQVENDIQTREIMNKKMLTLLEERKAIWAQFKTTTNLNLATYLTETTIKAMGSNRVDTELVAFGEGYIRLKEFGKKIVDNMPHKANTLMRGSMGGSTHLNDALKAIEKSLLKQKGKKIAVVITDGQTACEEDAQETARHLEKSIEFVGISIGQNSLKRIIPDAVQVNRPSEFVKAFIDELQRRVKRG